MPDADTPRARLARYADGGLTTTVMVERADLRAALAALDAAEQGRAAAEARVAALERIARWAQIVVDQSYIVGAEGWDGVECVPASWENALHSLQAALAPTAAGPAGGVTGGPDG